jgi:type IV secretory pathway TrbF-like protein
MAFGCLMLSVGLAGGMVWQSAQSRVTPYVVEVDKLGEVRAVGPAIESYQPSDAQIAWYLARFIADVRSLSIDPVLCARTGSKPMTSQPTARRSSSTTMPARTTLSRRSARAAFRFR